MATPGYEQNHWVSSQGYQEADWVIGHIPPDKYSVACVIGDSQPLTLEALAP